MDNSVLDGTEVRDFLVEQIQHVEHDSYLTHRILQKKMYLIQIYVRCMVYEGEKARHDRNSMR